MVTTVERAREIQVFVKKIYKIFGIDDAQVSASFIDELGEEIWMSSYLTADPARVTVNSKGKVEIILRESNVFLMGMIFNLLKFMIKTGMEENGYCFQQENVEQESIYFLDFSFR